MLKPPDFWYAQETLREKLIATCLDPLGSIYGWGVRKRFDLHFPIPMEKPVICVGNLTTGGTGKTPVALSLSDILQARGYNPHFLTRGYGGAERGPLQVAPSRDTAADVGDEALLLVEKAPTWVSTNRALGAQAAMDTGASLVIMDDGFQNPFIYKDFALIVVDGGVGFGNRRVFPAGPLREELIFGLSRAHAAVIIGPDKTGAREIIARHADIPVLKAALVPEPTNLDVAGKTIFAFAGIGRPDKFKDTLLQAGAVLEGWGAFPDHFAYIEDDLKELFAAADAQNVPVFTTAKDFVRLPPALKAKTLVFRVRLEWEEPREIADLVDRAVQRR
jgi:tetraacyldisaccharide 4'-kinase